MTEIVFHGFISPPLVAVSAKLPTVNFSNEGKTLEIQPIIANSVVRVEVKLPSFQKEDLVSILRPVTEITQIAVDLVSFSSGHGLKLLIESVETPDGHFMIDFHDPGLARECTVFALPSLDPVFKIFVTEIKLWPVLHDLARAITHFNEAVVNCARAVDGIKHFVAGPTASDKQAWAALQNALNLSESFLKMITDVSKENRHGKAAHVPGITLSESTRRTWVVMNRFMEWLIRGRAPLPKHEFPVL